MRQTAQWMHTQSRVLMSIRCYPVPFLFYRSTTTDLHFGYEFPLLVVGFLLVGDVVQLHGGDHVEAMLNLVLNALNLQEKGNQ